ncbi:MAG TPA: DNA polymerase III subunit alpha, partial [bacterium]|nr:DNA polymerase III subunit alpha [bacterium]
IVWDLIRFARSNGIPVGPGRGSVAGSIVAYALEITQVDPLKYDLLFERFLNPDRVSMPDIDMDFCVERRGEVIEYAKNKYGEDKVAMIITFGREKTRGAIRDVGRVLGIELPKVDKVAKLVPFMLMDEKVTIDNSIKHVPELKYMYDNDPEVTKLLDIARSIEGLARNSSTHAAGVVISKFPLIEHIPICKSPKDDMPVTQIEHDELEMIGLLKMDFLGLRNLTVMCDALKLIKKRTGDEIDLDNIPLDDKKTFKLLQEGKSNGVFQFEGEMAKKLEIRMQPDCIEDLIALNALNRPGPLRGGVVDIFMDNRKMKRDEIDYMHPLCEPVLRDTYGVILYQEQAMRMSNVIGGFSLAGADNLRRAMAKKKKAEMEKLEVEFIKGSENTIHDKKLGEHLFSQIEKFSGYGFNKSHSAVYAYIAYQTAYLKANYPIEFLSALITSVMDDNAKVAKYIEECRDMKIEVVPPDINVGYKTFAPDGDRVLFGMGAVKNVGENAIEHIVEEREKNGAYESIFEFCTRVDLRVVNVKAIESLIRSGAFDSLPGNRAQKMAVLDQAMDLGRAAQKDRESGQTGLFDCMDVIETSFEPSLPDIEEMDTEQLLIDEKELLGLYLSHHPLDPYREWIEKRADCTAAGIEEIDPVEKKKVTIAGIISDIRTFVIKTGDTMAFMEVEDFTGKTLVSVKPKELSRHSNILKTDSIVAVTGRVWVKQVDNPDGSTTPEYRVICEKIEGLNGPQKGAGSEPVRRRVHFRITADESDKGHELIRELKRLLMAHRGGCDVIVHLDDNGNARQFLMKGNEVRYSPEFIRLARRIFGDKNVWVESDRA